MTIHELSNECKLNNAEQRILEEYTANRFEGIEVLEDYDTSFLDLWVRIIDYAKEYGADKAINDKICAKRPIEFKTPDSLRIEIYDSVAGGIPIIYVGDASDFEQLVTNVAYKGIRPDNISSTGASFISGKTTRFIILSMKPYSNVRASELGLSDEDEWLDKSLYLRRGHECTHYLTKQLYGISNNILHDEIMADFIGMYEAFGFYKAEWFLRFMGIIPGSGNRLVVYIRELPENVRLAVSKLSEIASNNLEKWSNTSAFKTMSNKDRIIYMCEAGLEGMI